jgi:amidase
MADLHDLTALEQAAALRRGEVSPVELVDHYLARIAERSDDVGAFVTVTAEQAIAEAERALAALRDDPERLPPLFGVPTAIKDLNATAGVRTTFGSAAYDDFTPPYDDHVVSKLRQAGVISLGKTNTPEFGAPCYTEPDVAPPARTPWDLRLSAGGSSGGSAAAVAAGLVPFAQGSDGAGSIRIPASACGLVGIKPSRDRVSNGPLGDASGMAVMGPLARTVRDAAALLDAMAGPVPGDLIWPAPPETGTFLAAADRDPGRMRIGRYARPAVPDAVVAPECLAAYEEASRLLEDLGHDVVDVEPPYGPERVPLFELVWWVRSTLTPVPAGREDRLRPYTAWLRAQGAAASGTAYAAATAQLSVASRAAIAAVAAYDAVLTPTLALPPRAVGELRNDADPAADFAAQKRFTPFTAPYNISGQPAMSLPLHWTPAGIPIGIHLVGRPGGEATLVTLAAQLEAARPWRDRRPEIW